MFVLQREPGGMVEYLTLDPIYNVGNAFAAWAPDAKVAFGFARKADAENFQRKFKHFFAGHVTVGELRG